MPKKIPVKKKIGSIDVRIWKGDICDLVVDAIVNAANNHFYMGAGVAGAIKRRGGIQIEQDAVDQGPVPIGESVVTPGYKLAAKWVIHAAVMGMDFQTDVDKIRKATASALRKAAEIGVKSVAFPALGTGVGGFPFADCALIMLDELRRFAAAPSNVTEVTFALFSDEALAAFNKVATLQ